MKIVLFGLLLVAMVVCQRPAVKVGGFSQLTQEKLLMYRNENDIFKTAIKKAKTQYLITHNENLGDLVKASEQIVSGSNFRMVFNSNKGQVLITVYCQPWTNTYQVTQMKPYIEQP